MGVRGAWVFYEELCDGGGGLSVCGVGWGLSIWGGVEYGVEVGEVYVDIRPQRLNQHHKSHPLNPTNHHRNLRLRQLLRLHYRHLRRRLLLCHPDQPLCLDYRLWHWHYYRLRIFHHKEFLGDELGGGRFYAVKNIDVGWLNFEVYEYGGRWLLQGQGRS